MAKTGENIRKRKDVRWEGRYIKGRTDGKAVWGYVYARSYQEAKEILIQRKAECAYYAVSTQDPRFEELAQMWICSISNGIKESTIAHYKYTLKRYINPVFGDRNIKSFDEQSIEQGLLQVISPSDGSHKPLGHSAAKECLTMVRRIFKYARHLRLTRPMEIELTLPKPTVRNIKPLTREEQKKAESYALYQPTPRKLGLLLAMQLGLRIGEICGLQWQDFDLEYGILNINRTVQRVSCGNGHTRLIIQEPKTKTSLRQVPIPRTLLLALRAIRREIPGNVWFLSGNSEKPVEPRCYRKSLHAYLRGALVRSIHPHALRHTFASTCLQAGCDVKTLSVLLGHADASITLKRYVHTDLERMRLELERIYGRRKTA